MVDDQADLPVWGVDWRNPDLPSDLVTDLIRWQREFDDNFDPIAGWRSEVIRDRWSVQVPNLVAGLQKALGGNLLLEIDLWPLLDDD